MQTFRANEGDSVGAYATQLSEIRKKRNLGTYLFLYLHVLLFCGNLIAGKVCGSDTALHFAINSMETSA